MHIHKVAIVGAGPAGCYAAAALLKSYQEIAIDIYDKLFSPYGLVRTGVAPDHSKIKSVQSLFEKTLSDSRCRYLGNIEIGKDISIEDLRLNYSAVILAHGAESDRRLGIQGEDLIGSHTATDFVAWYNCHPKFKDRSFDLRNARNVAIIGQGNVAVDVARILAKPVSELAHTDIGKHAIIELEQSSIENIYIIGRRGPVQAAFTDKELKELGEIPGCDLIIDKNILQLSNVDSQELEQADKVKRSNYKILSDFAQILPRGENKKLHLVFFKGPVEIIGNSKVEKIKLERNILNGESGNQKAVGTGEFQELNVDLIFRSVGYLGKGITGLPFDAKKGVYPNDKGRVLTEDGNRLAGVYCAGWIKRGPSGVIGTNKACSVETVNSIIEDGLKPVDSKIDAIIKQRALRVLSFKDWKKIDSEELHRGEMLGKERDKFTNIDDVYCFLNK